MAMRRNIDLARQLSRAGRRYDGMRWLALTSLGQELRIRVKPGRRDLLIRTASPDIRVALSCLGGEFDELFAAIPTIKNPFIIDAGGYIGTAAIVLAEAYPEATVVTLEPSKANFALLKQNVSNYKNIVPMNKALAPEPGVTTLNNRGTGQWGFTIVSRPEDNPASEAMEQVECVTIGMLMAQFGASGIGVLKLDIEGGERALFSTDTGWIAKTEAICIELHDRIVHGCSDKFVEVTQGRRNVKMLGEKYLSLA
ncbi:FkbM family methyltransferase [Mesorhizobium sp. 1B3]|uniref:FkbM family methyltransferase n=1 Tax=Mesorhizobium sp. 1B3 TaxID=3243599 RepID=UPI003D97EC74